MITCRFKTCNISLTSCVVSKPDKACRLHLSHSQHHIGTPSVFFTASLLIKKQTNMLGFALLYFIGKYYYNLAVYHNKNKWGFAVLGIAAYYAGVFFFGVILGFILELSSNNSVNDMNSFVLGLIALPFGAGTTALLYHLLKKNWEKNKKIELEMIEQIGM